MSKHNKANTCIYSYKPVKCGWALHARGLKVFVETVCMPINFRVTMQRFWLIHCMAVL